MRKAIVLFLLLVMTLALVKSQNNDNYKRVDEIIKQIPDTSCNTTASIARYINCNFKTEREKIRAVFYWITNNIIYDLNNNNEDNLYDFSDKTIEQTIKTRKGVCVSFAVLLNDLANKVGLTSYIVVGYVKQNDEILKGLHAWNVVLVDGKWKFYESTWGSGYVSNGVYSKDFNESYFDVLPEVLIKTHKPFDPIWQLMNYLWTDAEFVEGKIHSQNEKEYFNFEDSIKIFLQLSEIDQRKSIVRRMEANEISNPLMLKWYNYNRQLVGYYNNYDFVAQYNLVVSLLNNAVNKYNTFVAFRNKQFKPAKPEKKIRQMINTVDSLYTKADSIIKIVKFYDDKSKTSILKLSNRINSGMKNVKKQKGFIEKYFSTPEPLRTKLFYQ